MERKECIRFINKNIPDENVRKLIFGDDEEDEDFFLNNRNDMLKYYSTMMNLAFTYVYSKYRIWRDNGGEVSENNNMNFRRAISTLDELYSTYDLSFEVMEGTLLDIQLDDSLWNEIKNGLQINDIKLNREFSKCAYKARKYRRTSRLTDDLDIAEQRSELINFFRSFPFLRDISILPEKVSNVSKAKDSDHEPEPYDKLFNVKFVYDNDFTNESEQILDTHGQIVTINGEYYFLDHIEVHDENDEFNDKTLFLNYTQIGEYDRNKMIIIENHDNDRNNEIITIRGEGVTESYYLDLFPGDMTLAESDNIIKDMHSINYKYVKNLSLAVSDILSVNGKLALKKYYSSMHEDIFKNTDSDTDDLNSYDWDVIVGMLLIRENANNVLKTIFLADSECYQKLLYNLEVRFGPERVNSKAIISDIQRKQEESTYNMEDLFCNLDSGHIAHSTKSMEINFENKSEVAACVIIDVLSKVSMDNAVFQDENYDFPIEMKGRIDFLNDLYRSNLSLGAKIQTLNSIVQHTLRGLICFYEGFFEYAEVKREFEDESYYRCLTEEEVNKYQLEAETKFSMKVKDVINELSDSKYSIIPGILKRVEELCYKCCNNKGEQTHYGKLLHDILGRNYILEFKELEILGQCIENINSIEDFDNAIEITTNVFRYLSTGSRKNQHIESIYPYVGTYEYTSHGKDGFNVARFTIITERKQLDVEVLSEFKYRIGDRYFCLPNLSRSNDSLWVDPVLIKMVDFDMNIVRGELNE